jgi:hypothetical protein
MPTRPWVRCSLLASLALAACSGSVTPGASTDGGGGDDDDAPDAAPRPGSTMR